MPAPAAPAPPAPQPSPPQPSPPKPPGTSGWRAWLPRVLAESALIVFSVLLALAVDEWRAGRAHRQQALVAEAEILAELRANRALVDDAQQYHAALLDSIAAHRQAARTPALHLFSRGFVAPAQLSHTAWTSAAETGALSHMDYATVLRLSEVYARQDYYAEQSRSIGQLLYAALYEGGTAAVAQNYLNLASLISAFRYREEQLVARYDDVLSSAPLPRTASGARTSL